MRFSIKEAAGTTATLDDVGFCVREKMKVLVRTILVALHLVNVLSEIPNLSNNEFNEDENRRFMKEQHEEASSSDSPNSANHFSDTLPGDPRRDYPTYTNIPKTRFSCQGKVNWRYYADIDTDCQIFHVCETDHSKISFVCPVGSIFNQRHLVCDWWYNFDCKEAEELYALRNELNEPEFSLQELDDDRIGFDLSLASSGGNSSPDQNRTENATTSEAKRRDRFKN